VKGGRKERKGGRRGGGRVPEEQPGKKGAMFRRWKRKNWDLRESFSRGGRKQERREVPAKRPQKKGGQPDAEVE